MSYRKARSVLFAPLLLLASCAPGSEPDQTEADAQVLREMVDQWVTAWNAADAANLASNYMDDAVGITADGPDNEGREAIQEWFVGYFDQFTSTQNATVDEVEVSGDVGFIRGGWRSSEAPRAGGAAVENTGKWLWITRRQPDGQWRIARHISNQLAHTVATPAVSVAQGAPEPAAEPLFAGVWMGGPLDSIYNAEYQRVQTVCAGAGDACYQTELDTTAVRLAPVFPSPDVGEPSGWLAARLRARGAWPYAGLLFVSAEGVEVPLIDDLGDWGYGSALDLVEARDGWLRPWMLAPAGGHWLGPEGGPGLGLVDGPYGLEGRLWRLGPVVASGPGGGAELPEGVYMVLEVRGGTARLRQELPEDMACGEPIDSTALAPPAPVHEVPLAQLLDASGRPRVQVAYGKGC
jgi:uncharacterized protein (TIGR02246 family)